MNKAFYFRDPGELCDFVKSLRTGLVSEQGFDLYQVPDPDSRGSVLLLAGVSPRKGRLRKKVDFSRQAGGRISWNGNRTHFTRHIRCRSLLEFIELQPWQASDKHEQHVIFRICRESLVADIVRDSLRLGNDRIQYAQIEDKNREIQLLRIERPSYYLIQRCLEDHAAEVELFHAAAEDLYLPWGKTHPLAAVWQISEQKRDHGWLFFHGDGSREHLEPLRWHDIYHLTEFRLDFPYRELVCQSKAAPAKFEVPLRLQPRGALTQEPELWLLDAAGRAELEGMLQLVDEEQIRPYHLAVQQLAGRDHDLVFVREKRAGSARKHLEFSGQAFAHYQGHQNFFLPAGQELLPPLRRDLYRGLFQLEPGILTVVVPQAEGGYSVLRVRERAFQPLTSFLDYIIQSEVSELEDLLAASVFDFEEYLTAPSRSDLRHQKAGEGNLERAKPANAAPQNRQAKEAELDKLSVDDVLSRQSRFEDGDLTGLQAGEREQERALVTQQSPEAWLALLLSKHQLGKRDEAVVAAIEGLWLCDEPAQESEFRRLLRDQLDGSETAIPSIDQVSGDEAEATRRAALFRHLAQSNSEQTDQWVAATSAFLQKHETQFRAKERWLAWGEVIRRNHDERREAQVREQIRNQIGESGLGLEETPSFIRTRVVRLVVAD